MASAAPEQTMCGVTECIPAGIGFPVRPAEGRLGSVVVSSDFMFRVFLVLITGNALQMIRRTKRWLLDKARQCDLVGRLPRHIWRPIQPHNHMKQIFITGHGGPEKLQLRESPDPTPGRGEIRIRVKASGINFADILARQGLYPDSPKIPCVVGYEVSGVVDAVGAGAEASWTGREALH
jgi:hypothetical protein